MSNFKQPVSMICSKEQFKTDIKNSLEELGYKDNHICISRNVSIIYTNAGGDAKCYSSDTFKNDRTNEYRRVYISHYNPQLFLAIAAMREGDELYGGEILAPSNSGHVRKATLEEIFS